MSRRVVIHNHFPRSVRDAGRAVSREEEERNREAAYRQTGISRDVGSMLKHDRKISFPHRRSPRV